MSLYVYADESGDLGWSFNEPYGKRGSSRYLTICAICVPEEKIYRVDRVVRGTYLAAGWKTTQERKWIDARDKSRIHFVNEAAKLAAEHSDISYHAIVVYKPNVQKHIREDPNKLYNFMLKLLLLKEMAKHPRVCLVPDGRSIKVASGNSMHDYLQTCLWLHEEAPTILETTYRDSAHCKGLQFADFMAGAVNACFETGKRDYLNAPGLNIDVKKLYFP